MFQSIKSSTTILYYKVLQNVYVLVSPGGHHSHSHSCLLLFAGFKFLQSRHQAPSTCSSSAKLVSGNELFSDPGGVSKLKSPITGGEAEFNFVRRPVWRHQESSIRRRQWYSLPLKGRHPSLHSSWLRCQPLRSPSGALLACDWPNVSRPSAVAVAACRLPLPALPIGSAPAGWRQALAL